MKITIVLGPFQPMPPAGMGAVEKVWCELGRLFAARGHEVTIIGRGNAEIQASMKWRGMYIKPMRGYDASGFLVVDLLKDFFYAVHAVMCVPRSDVIVTNTFWAPVLLAPFKKWKGRIVVHVARFPKGQMWLYRGVDVLQAISSAVASAIREQSPSVGGKVQVLGYPVDLSVFKPDSTPQDKSRPAVYIGRIHPEKGIHLLIEAFRLVSEKVPDATLQIVGPIEERQGGGGTAYLQKLKAAAGGLPITFHGPLTDEYALADIYRNAACFCYPSLAEHGEAFGRAMLEAMACGIPCVVSALECFQDFVRHGENALVFDHRAANAVERLAEAVCSLFSDREYAARLGKAATVTAECFSSTRMADEYLQMFRTVISGTGGPLQR